MWAPDGKPRDRQIRIECKTANKNLMNLLQDQLSKKSAPMMFQSTQQQHLQGCQAYHIESKMSQLYDWIEQQYKQRSDLKEAANYD
jgi:hypothetical protein